jgi:hypothetical protein
MLTMFGVPVHVSGVAGHFCAADKCVLRLHWRIGNYRISTIGGYRGDPKSDAFSTVGYKRSEPAYSETMIFALRDDGTEEGDPTSWTELTGHRLTDPDTRAAERQHYVIAGAVAKAVASGRSGIADIRQAVAQAMKWGAHG